jgi:hypothetical protein
LEYGQRADLQALAGAFPSGRLRMASSKQLRERAARFLAMAINAQHQGDTALAELLTVKAANYMDEAASAEASDAPPPLLGARQQNVQQQRQVQPKKEDGAEDG